MTHQTLQLIAFWCFMVASAGHSVCFLYGREKRGYHATMSCVFFVLAMIEVSL